MRRPTNDTITRRALLTIIENLWDKYAVSRQALEAEQASTLAALNGFLAGLGYLGQAQ